MTDIDRFFSNFPLTFINRDPQEQKITNIPSSLKESKIYILKNPAKKVESYHVLQLLYLCAIGEFEDIKNLPENTSNIIKDLLKNNFINETEFGFIYELDKSRRKNRFKLGSEDDLKNASHHKLLRFCYSRGINPVHNVSTEELQKIAKWVLCNKGEDFSSEKLQEYLQNSIDLSVIAQNLDKMSDDLVKETSIDQNIKKHVQGSEELLESTIRSFENVSKLNSYISNEVRYLPYLAYQQQALNQLPEQKNEKQVQPENPH